jgi:hypothetical protein
MYLVSARDTTGKSSNVYIYATQSPYSQHRQMNPSLAALRSPMHNSRVHLFLSRCIHLIVSWVDRHIEHPCLHGPH